MAAPPIDPVHVYDIQTRARRRLFDWVRRLSQAQYIRPFPFGLETVRATLLEIARSELFYVLRLRERPIPAFDERFPISATRQPAFADLEAAWEPQMREVRATLEGTTDWDRRVTCEIPWPDRIVTLTAAKADIAAQLFLHDVHHRAQAMAMLRLLGVRAQDLDYLPFAQERRVRTLDAASEPERLGR